MRPINATYINGLSEQGKKQLLTSNFNTLILTFLSFKVDEDKVQGIVDGSLASGDLSQWMAQIKQSDKTLLFSVGGEFVSPQYLEFLFQGPDSDQINAATYSQVLSLLQNMLTGGKMVLTSMTGKAFAVDFGPGFDGIDLDLENFTEYASDSAINTLWVNRLHHLNLALRQDLGPDCIITHAPQTPYMLSSNAWPGANGTNTHGLYSQLMARSGSALSWINVQIYNQGNFKDPHELENLLEALFMDFPQQLNVPLEKLVLTLPFSSTQAGSGYVSPDMLEEAIQGLISKGVTPQGYNGWASAAYDTVTPAWDKVFKNLLSQ